MLLASMDKQMLRDFYSGNKTLLDRNENLLAEIRNAQAENPDTKIQETNDTFRICF